MTRTLRQLAVIGAVALVTVASACTRMVDGNALTAEIPDHDRAPSAVPVGALEGLLLTPAQLVVLVDGANLAFVFAFNSTSDASTIVDDRACLGMSSVGDVTTYASSGYVGMRGNQYGAPDAVLADVTQLVVTYTSAADAQAQLQRVRQDWQGCANRRYGFHSSNGNHSYFNTQDLRARGSRIEVSMRQEEDPRWGCSHAIAAQSSVVVEGRVCLLSKDTAQAVKSLLDQVLAKIPQ
jgi:hypothetical protein